MSARRGGTDVASLSFVAATGQSLRQGQDHPID
jgi:hypothetical protein